ncbi:MAG: RNA polymerase sigma factor, partial [Oscillospiraceae bacterium]|nr:RNA polymerase sigma factor [Oscillospiraceae bacterium]
EDVFQETFFKLSVHKKGFRDEEHLKAWLIRVAINECKMIKRSEANRLREELDDNSADNSADFTYGNPVADAVMSLPEKYRLAVLYYYYYGFSCDEAAKLMKISEPAVRTRLKRAREKLKEILREEWNDEKDIR